jgi:anti-sigma regulatory factor (Ser/Thr protein kinase)
MTRVAALRLPVDTTSPRRARRFVRDQLHQWGRAELADAAELMVSELVTNAIVHAQSPSELLACDDGETLRVEVVDWGDGTLVLRDPDPGSSNGRGLRFVDALAARWGFAPNGRGKRVWFELTRGMPSP